LKYDLTPVLTSFGKAGEHFGTLVVKVELTSPGSTERFTLGTVEVPPG
jgi:hypothetical protein